MDGSPDTLSVCKERARKLSIKTLYQNIDNQDDLFAR
jgi:hypothetical protein